MRFFLNLWPKAEILIGFDGGQTEVIRLQNGVAASQADELVQDGERDDEAQTPARVSGKRADPMDISRTGMGIGQQTGGRSGDGTAFEINHKGRNDIGRMEQIGVDAGDCSIVIIKSRP